MKAPSARSRRASAPLSTTKRAPDMRLAAAKSISPSASPISTWSLASKSKLLGSPTLRISRLALSSAPMGTAALATLGRPASRSRSRASRSRSASSRSRSSFLSPATSSTSARTSSPRALAAPISFDARLRRACSSCRSVRQARSSSSRVRMSAAAGAKPRLASAASNGAGLSRIHLMSSMAWTLQKPPPRGSARNPAAGKRPIYAAPAARVHRHQAGRLLQRGTLQGTLSSASRTTRPWTWTWWTTTE